ncbi:hypothetical protein OIU78_004415 [Salix suchowensis]|nr:hypothetical protein OIU78_004415 [Salix suchowensis]
MYSRKKPWTSFLYFIVPGKSTACQPETLLINQFPAKDFKPTDVADEAAMMRGNAIHPIFFVYEKGKFSRYMYMASEMEPMYQWRQQFCF